MPPFPELKDITPPTPPALSSPEEVQRVVWLLFAVVVAVMALIVFWFWWRSRNRHRRPPPLPLSALEEARRGLAQIETLAPQLEAPALGQQVCEVLRHYLERQYGLLARYRTTEELLGAARNPTIPPPPFLQPFAPVLRRCDDLKFAGAAVPSARRLDLVRETLAALSAPPPVPPPGPTCEPTADPDRGAVIPT